MDTKNHKIYWNLHKKCWSVKPVFRGGKVDHAYVVAMEDVRLVVQPAGRERARREGKKNVHAYAKGIIVKRIENQPHDSTVGMLVQTALAAEWRRVTYNPYEHNTFVDVGNGRPVRRAAKVLALPGGSVWYTPEEDV